MGGSLSGDGFSEASWHVKEMTCAKMGKNHSRAMKEGCGVSFVAKNLGSNVFRESSVTWECCSL
jgi:hypothetical protein